MAVSDDNPALPEGCTLLFMPPPDVMEAVYRLRVSAWRARTDAFPDMPEWRDAYDDMPDTMHWAIIHGGEPVAAARMTVHAALADLPNAEIYDGILPADLAGPIASINRLVVARSWAGQGLPLVLDQARIFAAKTRGCLNIVGETYAGNNRIAHVERLGFQNLGPTAPYHAGPLAAVKNKRGGGDRLPAVLLMPVTLLCQPG